MLALTARRSHSREKANLSRTRRTIRKASGWMERCSPGYWKGRGARCGGSNCTTRYLPERAWRGEPPGTSAPPRCARCCGLGVGCAGLYIPPGDRRLASFTLRARLVSQPAHRCAVAPGNDRQAVMLEKHEVCCALFHGFDWSKWTTGKPTQTDSV